MFLDGRLEIGFDSNTVSLDVLKIGTGIVDRFHEEEGPASMWRRRIAHRQMKTFVGAAPNELAHDEWFVGENEQTQKTENQRH